MSRYQANLPSLVIPTTTAVSTGIFIGHDVAVLRIVAPATLSTNAIIQASVDGTTWADAQSGGTDVVISQGSVVVFEVSPGAYVRVTSVAASEAAARTFTMSKDFDV